MSSTTTPPPPPPPPPLPLPLPPPQTQQRPYLTVFATFHVQPARVEEFKAAHQPVWAACAAEPECLLFDVFRDRPPPPLQNKTTREWFETQQLTKPYYAELWAKSRPTWELESGRDVEIEYFEGEGEGFKVKEAYLLPQEGVR